MEVFILSLEVCLTSSTRHVVLFTLSILVYQEVFLLELSFAMLTSKFSFLTIHEMISNNLSDILVLAVHTLNFLEVTLLVDVLLDVVTGKPHITPMLLVNTIQKFKFTLYLFMNFKFVIRQDGFAPSCFISALNLELIQHIPNNLMRLHFKVWVARTLEWTTTSFF